MQERTFFILCKPFSIGSFAEASHSLFSASALQNSIPECNHNRDVSTFHLFFFLDTLSNNKHVQRFCHFDHSLKDLLAPFL